MTLYMSKSLQTLKEGTFCPQCVQATQHTFTYTHCHIASGSLIRSSRRIHKKRLWSSNDWFEWSTALLHLTSVTTIANACTRTAACSHWVWNMRVVGFGGCYSKRWVQELLFSPAFNFHHLILKNVPLCYSITMVNNCCRSNYIKGSEPEWLIPKLRMGNCQRAQIWIKHLGIPISMHEIFLIKWMFPLFWNIFYEF